MGTGGGGQNSADLTVRGRYVGEQEVRKAEKDLEGIGEAAKGAAKAQGELTQASEQTASVGEQLTGVFDAMDAKLGEFGLNIRAVTVALGAGLAGGVTAFLRAAVVGTQAIVGFIGDLIAEERNLDRETEAAFGSASESVRRFVDDSAGFLNTTRTELTETVIAFQQFANVLRIPEEEATRLSEAVGVLAAGLTNLAPGVSSASQAGELLQRAITGSDEALAQLGISLRDFDQAAEEAFGKPADTLTVYERQLVVLDLAHKRVTDNLERAGEDLRSIWTRIREEIVGPVTTAINALTSALDFLDRQLQRVGTSIGEFALAINPVTRVLVIANRLFGNSSDAVDEFGESVKRAEGNLSSQASVLRENSDAFLRNTSQVRQAEDAFRSLDRARVDGARQVQEAQIRLSRAIQDALHRETELRIRNARAAEDAARDIGRALEDIARAQEQNTLSLASAQARFEEAQIQSFRAIRTAQERLEDFLRDSARRREDIQRRIARAREQEVKDLTEAIIAIEDAQREGDAEGENRARRNLARLQQEERGNKALEDALRDLARLQEDTVRQRQRLERALLESQLDAGRRQQQASRDLARARIEANNRIIEAERRLQDATQRQSRAAADAARSMARLAVENQRAIADAQRAIENASRNMARSVGDASRALQRMAQDIGLTVEQMRRLIQHAEFLRRAIEMFGFNPFASGSQFFPRMIGLQHGGRFQFGQPFIAGEVGPELVIPDQSGRVLSNEELVRLMRDSGGGGGPSITINEVAGDPEATAFAVNSRLARGIS